MVINMVIWYLSDFWKPQLYLSIGSLISKNYGNQP